MTSANYIAAFLGSLSVAAGTVCSLNNDSATSCILHPAVVMVTERLQDDTAAAVADTLAIGPFSAADTLEGSFPKGWRPMTFRGIRNTKYRLTSSEGTMVIRADAERSSSGLIYQQDIDLTEYPVIEWSWRIENALENGDVTQKSGDDYAARIYVIFDYELSNLPWGQRNMIRALRTFYGQVPARAINYIHATNAEPGLITPNPYSDLVTMVVVDSGINNLGQWRSFRRNIYEDYLMIYEEPPPTVRGVAIMTDSDDTGETVTAFFGDIRFLAE